MSKILLVVSTVLLLASAVLGFLTKGKVVGLRTEIASLNETVQQKDAENKTLEANLETTRAEAATAKAAQEKAEADLAVAKQEGDKARADLTAANAQVEAKNQELERVNKELVSRPADGPKGPGGDTVELQTQLKEAQTQLAEALQVKDSLTAKVTEVEAQSAELKKRAEQRDRQVMAQGIEGQVLAVNQAWNFVVLSIGDRQGVVPSAQMIVTRNGEMIAKVRITSVEPSTSIADLIPGSVAKGVRVQPGDRVIYPGA